MLLFIAGARSTGAIVARYNDVRKSSAMPLANLPITFAVHGATSSSATASSASGHTAAGRLTPRPTTVSATAATAVVCPAPQARPIPAAGHRRPGRVASVDTAAR